MKGFKKKKTNYKFLTYIAKFATDLFVQVLNRIIDK